MVKLFRVSLQQGDALIWLRHQGITDGKMIKDLKPELQVRMNLITLLDKYGEEPLPFVNDYLNSPEEETVIVIKEYAF